MNFYVNYSPLDSMTFFSSSTTFSLTTTLLFPVASMARLKIPLWSCKFSGKTIIRDTCARIQESRIPLVFMKLANRWARRIIYYIVHTTGTFAPQERNWYWLFAQVKLKYSLRWCSTMRVWRKTREKCLVWCWGEIMWRISEEKFGFFFAFKSELYRGKKCTPWNEQLFFQMT